MVGVAGLPVTLSNATNAGVTKWVYELLDAPLNSALTPGILSSGASPTVNFTPDNPATPGCYRVKLTVFTSGPGCSSSSIIRNFAVPTTQGWILPPFKAKAAELNFPGNTEGWEQLLNEIFLTIPSGGGGNGGQLMWGDNSVSTTTTTRYLTPGYDDSVAETRPTEMRLSRGGTLRNLRVRHSRAGVGAANLTYTLFINSLPTTITASLAASAQDAADLANLVAVAPGALAALEVTKAGVITQSPNGVVATLEYV